MPYYIEGKPETNFLKICKPEEIKLLDPASGSGHMLTYAFDLLYAIYEEEGYAPSDIPALILRHNLHGVEICDRAAALAAFALCMKARASDRRFFSRIVQPNVISLQDVHFEEGELSAYFKALGSQPSAIHLQLANLLHQFEEAKNFGSLIQPCLNEQVIQSVRSQIENQKSRIENGDLLVTTTHLKVLRVLEQAEALTQQYHIVVANPPYMGLQNLNSTLKTHLLNHFGPYKGDLFAAFIARIFGFVMIGGFTGMMTPFTWMFIKSYESIRRLLLKSYSIRSLIRPEYHAFFESAFVPICAFIVFHGESQLPSTYIDLGKFYGADAQDAKVLEAISSNSCPWKYSATATDFLKIPGMPIAYWASPGVLRLFASLGGLGDSVEARQGLITADNGRFMRRWWEPSGDRTEFPKVHTNITRSAKRWFPYNKGGVFRKWYGNGEFVVNWENDGYDIKGFSDSSGNQLSRPQNTQFYFRESVSWSDVTADINSFRWYPPGYIFDATGHSAFSDEVSAIQLLAMLNTKLMQNIAKILNPTMHFHVGYFRLLPAALLPEGDVKDLVTEAIASSRQDWDNFETSWDFRDQPLLLPGLKGATLEASWRNWEAQSNHAIHRMQELETENNRLFIAAYGLQDELQPEVPDEQITLARADVKKDMAAFISYAVGCMMGRYSLDLPGLILADAGGTVADYLAKVPKPTFAPDADGILPVLDGEWFEDDIVARFREFLRVTFGEATLNENLRLIEGSLGKDLRKYFLTDFYKNHISGERAYGYKKRPIYWLFRSPNGGFAVLVYLHRMTRDTPNLILNRYLRNYLPKLRSRIEHLDHVQATATTARDKTTARKESDQLKKTLRECEDWERDVLLPLAQSRPELDLDDGVKVNYLKLGEALAPIPGLAAADEE